MGNVHVLNAFSETIGSLALNGLSAGTISHWSMLGYSLQSIAVQRVQNAGDAPGKFFNGRNTVQIAWDSGTYTCQVQIDGNEFPLVQDLLLVLSLNKWILQNQSGVVVAEGDVMRYPFNREALDDTSE